MSTSTPRSSTQHPFHFSPYYRPLPTFCSPSLNLHSHTPFLHLPVPSLRASHSASQKYNVPRKTLRNWMKRCDIKSVFPMPHQLKKAADRKRQWAANNAAATAATTTATTATTAVNDGLDVVAAVQQGSRPKQPRRVGQPQAVTMLQQHLLQKTTPQSGSAAAAGTQSTTSGAATTTTTTDGAGPQRAMRFYGRRAAMN